MEGFLSPKEFSFGWGRGFCQTPLRGSLFSPKFPVRRSFVWLSPQGPYLSVEIRPQTSARRALKLQGVPLNFQPEAYHQTGQEGQRTIVAQGRTQQASG